MYYIELNNIRKYNNLSQENRLVKLLTKKVDFLRVVVYIVVGVLIFESFITIYISNSNPDFEYLFQLSGVKHTEEASLFLVPNVVKCKAGEEFNIDILTNTGGNNVVVAAAYLSYNQEKLEAISIDVESSDFVLFAEKEIIKKEGKIKITAGKPTPGVNSSSVKVASVRFKALKPVETQIYDINFDFTVSSSRYSTIILDDKKGTNILSSTHGVNVNIEQ